jgi:hypothetical protein
VPVKSVAISSRVLRFQRRTDWSALLETSSRPSGEGVALVADEVSEVLPLQVIGGKKATAAVKATA